MKLRLPPALRSVVFACLAAIGGLLPNSATAQVMQSKLLAPVPDPGSKFGEAVALVPGWAFSGSATDDSVVPLSGSVFVHRRVGDQWEFSQTLKAPAPDIEAFGHAIASWDEWMVATAPHDNLGLSSGTKGSAHVFRLQNGTWTHHQQIYPNDFASPATDAFGFGDSAVAMAEGVLVIGGLYSDFNASNAGAAYIFELQGANWVQTSKLLASDWVTNGAFGVSTATDGLTIVVGAYRHSGAPTSDQGCAYVFERIGGVWTQTQKLVASDPASQNFFGTSVAVSGDAILVGAHGHKHTSGPALHGAAYAYSRQGPSWVQIQELTAHDPKNQQLFGSRVLVQGNLALVSARGDSSGRGAGYLLRRIGGIWMHGGKLLAPDGSPSDVLGYASDLAGTEVILGAYEDDSGCNDAWNCGGGSSYVFELAPDTIQFGHCLAAGVCDNHDDHGGCANTSGQGAVLAAGGSTSTSADSLELEARWLPQNVFGILFMGGATNWVPIGDGRLALSGGALGVYRFLPPQLSGTAGALIWDGGIVTQSQSFAPAGHIDAGETWFFQAWYRDPTGPCGSGFNVSNGLQVDFTP